VPNTALGPLSVEELPEIDAYRFWTEHVATYTPLVVRGGALPTIQSAWDDDFMLANCNKVSGAAWRSLIEKNNRVVQNDRHPLMYDWTFCDFIRNYKKPEYRNMLYVVSPLSERGVSLRSHLSLPELLRCEEIYSSVYEARLWMSGGNTTSSLHFDTHDNLMLQLDGSKDVFLWHPNETHKFYSDFHNKYGLSPISADRVDLDRYPEFARAATHHMHVRPGDAFYLPDGWWHLIRSHGRNIAIAIEFEPVHDDGKLWPPAVTQRYKWPGLFWAEQVVIKYAMRERYLPRLPSKATRKPVACEKRAPRSHPFSKISWLGREH